MHYIHIRAHGKINLGLDILRKREDGYHEVKMIMQSVGLYDKIEITLLGLSSTDEPEIDIETNLRYLPSNENNLAYKAAYLLMSEYKIKAHISIKIKKMIPVSAGMAGGSTDCAAVLKGINKLFNLGLSIEKLKEYGVTLGADVPYCIEGGTALSEGIGEKLTKLPDMPPCIILLAKPPINVSTKFVYGNLDLTKIETHPDIDGMIEAIKAQDLKGMVSKMGNLLETVTEKEYPIITELKEMMVANGALGSMMSGSGPTVFGIFDSREKAKAAYEVVKASGLARQVYLTDGGDGNERY
ncbi:MAG: 4-(cytidine 5'-diphospho)-2-C-methyl-D-erythritol kinase [Lachnospiraceae bacterium]|nr:4-(cytidine 5'-diphospho)-2-C-methyl-D-erythritol kinase [Lachnospiraceae bacterium]